VSSLASLTPEQAEIRSLKGQAKRLMINNTPIVIDRKTIFLLPVIMGVLLIFLGVLLITEIHYRLTGNLDGVRVNFMLF
jgi:hypothetical protein